ncbi:MAG: hypothetical protein JXR97_12130 [Planctomycetes bacterium]|nr:hypothetical protein [Planctomycetota bacterium]
MENGNGQEEDFFCEANLIFSYTRKQAIADGVLVDVSEMAQEAGFIIPVAVTVALYAEVVTPSEEATETLGQSRDGRLWDLLWMLLMAIRRAKPTDDPQIIRYEILVAELDGTREVELKAVCGPNDDATPCITVMYPYED